MTAAIQETFLTGTFGLYVKWIPVCPELEVGRGIPREPVRLVGAATDPLMIAERCGKDWRLRMNQYVRKRIKLLAQLDLSGYVFNQLLTESGPPGAQS
jgi:uncharacterized protein YbbK (DUF523 family)